VFHGYQLAAAVLWVGFADFLRNQASGFYGFIFREARVFEK
jgi:hypothetical protein